MYRAKRVCGLLALVLALTITTAENLWDLPPGATPAAAQGGDDACQQVYFDGVAELMAQCADLPNGNLCWASGDDVVIDTVSSGQLVSGPGTRVPFGVVTSVTIPDNSPDEWKLVRIHLVDPVNYNNFTTLLALGPLNLEVVEDDMPPGSSFTLQTGAEPPCPALPHPGLLVQSPAQNLALLRVNGIDMVINGTAVLHSPDGVGVTVSAISRETILGATGTVVFAGYRVTVAEPGAAPVVEPYDPAAVAYLPTNTLPRVEVVPVPGNATVIEEINLFLRPQAEAYTNTMIAAGLPVSVLGQSTSREWLYVRAYDGTQGWMPRGYLNVQVSVEPPMYDEAPRPLTRPFGPVQSSGVTTTEYNRLRSGPGLTFEEVGHLALHVPVDVYARSPDNEWLLVETDEGVRAWLYIDLYGPTTDFDLANMPYSPDFLPED
ncbi:MAG: hypothetical protein GYB65_16835 [Chloroflexi bacterium]|nr:hypothetical protein [Chloroflexota bacterium]